MSNIAEYVWIDASGNTRSKSRTLSNPFEQGKSPVSSLPNWNFDGSSTGQADGHDSEVVLNPQAVYSDPFRGSNGILVLCDCYDRNGNPIETNTRFNAVQIFDKISDQHPWYGMEQEYVLYDCDTKRPLGWPSSVGQYPEPQGKYYCGAGGDRVFGREIVDEHYKICLEAGIQLSGINAEVMPGQWEFQVGPCEAIKAGDQLYMARYLLHRVCEKYNVFADLSPKPELGDWNGSGCHTNFSSKAMREDGGIGHIQEAIDKLSHKHAEHIDVYGDNSERLIGTHETSSISKFSSGVADRTASVRIPSEVNNDGKGYFEDRRPASNCDPYLVTAKLAETTLL
jgi:glutamine synthetase